MSFQSLVKRAAHAAGLEIRYAFQNPPITHPGIYKRWLAQADVRCIVDVGANIGQSARRYAAAFPNSTVHSFEPFPAAYQDLEAVSSASGGRIKAYQLACGDADGLIVAPVDKDPKAQTNRLIVSAGAAAASSVTVTVARLDAICAERGITSIDILKTDTEGYDAKVLAGASGLLASGRVRCVISEVGFIGDQHHTQFSEVYGVLQRYGFELAGLYEASYRPDLVCDFANALFVHAA